MSEVVSVVAQVLIADVARRRSAILRKHFTPAECRTFARRADRSVAAALALKQAAVALLGTIRPLTRFTTRDVRVSHTRAGAPRVTVLKATGMRNSLHVSAAHTAGRAFGLVSFPREQT